MQTDNLQIGPWPFSAECLALVINPKLNYISPEKFEAVHALADSVVDAVLTGAVGKDIPTDAKELGVTEHVLKMALFAYKSGLLIASPHPRRQLRGIIDT